MVTHPELKTLFLEVFEAFLQKDRAMIIDNANERSLCTRLAIYLECRKRKYDLYAKLALPAVVPFGARILARGDAAVAREQGLKERTVVVEYPSLEKATAAYDSAAYAEALKALGNGAVRDFRIVEGLD